MVGAPLRLYLQIILSVRDLTYLNFKSGMDGLKAKNKIANIATTLSSTNPNSSSCSDLCFSAGIWSLVATLFYVVYGQAPFIARSVFERYDCICTVKLQFHETAAVSKSLQSHIGQLLEKEAEKRATYNKIIY